MKGSCMLKNSMRPKEHMVSITDTSVLMRKTIVECNCCLLFVIPYSPSSQYQRKST